MRPGRLAGRLQRLSKQRLRFGVAALHLVEEGEDIETAHRVRMWGAKGVAALLQHLLEERFGFLKAAR